MVGHVYKMRSTLVLFYVEKIKVYGKYHELFQQF